MEHVLIAIFPVKAIRSLGISPHSLPLAPFIINRGEFERLCKVVTDHHKTAAKSMLFKPNQSRGSEVFLSPHHTPIINTSIQEYVS